MKKLKEKRLFIGIRITPDKEFLRWLRKLQVLLQDYKINWVDPRNFHVTLKFLGNIEPSLETSIAGVLKKAVCKHERFTLSYTQTGYFVRKQNPEVLWLGIEPGGHFRNMAGNIETGLQELGIAKSGNSSVPHLTLGRIKERLERSQLDEKLAKIQHYSNTVEVRSVQLVQSILNPSGPIYLTRKEVFLVL